MTFPDTGTVAKWVATLRLLFFRERAQMNNFEAFNALLSLVNTSEDGSIEEHLA